MPLADIVRDSSVEKCGGFESFAQPCTQVEAIENARIAIDFIFGLATRKGKGADLDGVLSLRRGSGLGLEFDVDAGLKIEMHQRIHRLGRGQQDIDKPLCVRISKCSRLFLST